MSSKERRFVHPDRQKGEGKHPLEKNILHAKESITSDDIAAYVKDLVIELKQQSRKNAQETYIIQALSDDVLARRFFQQRQSFVLRILSVISEDAKRHLQDVPELRGPCEDAMLVQQEIQRIRRAAEEELKKQLTQDPELEGIRYSDIHFESAAPFANSRDVRVIEDLNTKKQIFKRGKSFGDNIFDVDSLVRTTNHEKALKKLAILPSNEHLLLPEQIDSDASETITPYTDFEDQGRKSREARERPYSFYEDLSVLRDCVKGALFLADHGLVLQDIRPENIGSYQKDGRRIGVLFDLEGIYPLNDSSVGRFASPGYLPPEVSTMKSTRVSASEMVYQLGASLAEITTPWMSDASIPELVREEVKRLCEYMMAYDKVAKNPILGRISLSESLARLNDLIEKVSASEPPASAGST